VAVPLAVSEVALVSISAGAGLLGVLIGGLVTYFVEHSREEHEKKVDRERRNHEDAVREQRDRHIARGLARALSEELAIDSGHAATESQMRAWIRLQPTPRLSPEDRKELFRHLSDDEYLAVVAAQSALRGVALVREVNLKAEEKRPYTADTAEWVRPFIEEADRAIDALKRLGRQ
jgi:hypothetical protein